MRQTLLKFLIGMLIIPLYLWGTVTNSGTSAGTNTSGPYVDDITITVDVGDDETIDMKNFYHNFSFPRLPNTLTIIGTQPEFVVKNETNYTLRIKPTTANAGVTYTFRWEAAYYGPLGSVSSNNSGTITILVKAPTTSPSISSINLGGIHENTNKTIDISSYITQGTYPIDHVVITSGNTSYFTENLHGDYRQLLVNSPAVASDTSYSVQYKVCDDHSNCSSEATISFISINHTPPKTQNLSFSYEENNGIKHIDLKSFAIQTEGDPILTVSALSSYSFITFNSATNQVDINTDSAPVGTYSITWSATDADGPSTNPEKTITITITAKAIIPPTTRIFNIYVNEGETATTTLDMSKITKGTYNVDLSTIAFQNFPTWASYNPITHIISVNPDTSVVSGRSSQTFYVGWQVADDHGNKSTFNSIIITVTDVPPPTAHSYTIYMEKGTTLSQDDTDSRGTRVSPAWHADGTKYEYRHRPSYMSDNDRGYIDLHPSTIDDTYFEYRVYRNSIWTSWTKVNIHVTNPPPPNLNSVPIPTLNVRLKTIKDWDLLGYVKTFLSTVDQVKITNNPDPSFIALSSSGILHLNPTLPSQVTPVIPHQVKWKAHNPDGGWSTTERLLTVNVWEGTPPIANDKTYIITLGQAFDFKLLGSSIIQTDGDSIKQYKIQRTTGEPIANINIKTTLSSGGRIYGTPNQAGTYHFKFKAEDFDGWSQEKTFTLIVNNGTPPASQDIEITVAKGNYFQWNLETNGGITKTEGNPITAYRYTNDTLPSYPDVRREDNPIRVSSYGNFRGRPPAVGDYSITFEAKDIHGWSTPKTFTLHVIQGPPPNTQSGTLTAEKGRYYDCGLDLIQGDPCGTAYIQKTSNSIRQYEINGTIPGMTIRESSSVILGTPTQEGNYTLTFRARDDDGWSNPATLQFNVPGTPPVINVPDFNYTIGRSPTLNIDLSNYASDNHGDIISYSWLSGLLPTGMSWSGTTPTITMYEDAQDGNTDGWRVYDNDPTGATFSNIYDNTLKSRVIETHSDNDSTANGFILGWFNKYYNGGWGNTTQKIISWKMNFSTSYVIYVRVKTSDWDGYIYYTAANTNYGGTGSYVHYGLGSSSQNGTWHTFTRDLEADLKKFQPDNDILEVNGFLIRGSGRVDDITLSSSITSATGIFSGNPTTEGNYSIGVGATDKDGMSIDTFNINVLQPVPPNVQDQTITIDEGDSLNYNLFSNGAVLETDGDTIDRYEINTTVPGITFDTATGTFSGSATTAGNYDVGFRAHDLDNWSTWGVLHIIVNPVVTTNDVCFAGLDSNSYANSDTIVFFNCKDDLSGEYRGGLGCEQTINITNQSDKNLTNFELALDHTPPYNVTYNEYGKNGVQIGDGTEQTHFNFGSYDFNKGTKFDMGWIDPYKIQKIYTKKGVIPNPTIDKPVFNGNNLYAKYRKEGILHISKVQKCIFGYDKDLDVDSDFKLIYGGPGNAVLGDIAATGDAILYVNDPVNDHYNRALSEADTHYILSDSNFASDSDVRKRNASSASLNLPSYVKGSHIKWAGLFWQGYVHTPEGSTLSPASIAQMNTDVTGWNSVKLKTPDGVYHTITADMSVKDVNNSTYHYGMVDHNSSRFFYSAYHEITDLVKNTYSDVNNTFTVGNIMTTAGKDYADSLYISHANHDAGQWNVDESGGGSVVGYFGGWSIVVVYDLIGTPEALDTSITDVYKNIALYNGYDFFMTWGDGDVSFEKEVSLSGFRTPGSGTVNSNMIFFGGGADQNESADTLQIQQKKTSNFDNIYNTLNPLGNQFNNTYTKNNSELNSTKTYHHGMDLDIYDVASSMDHNQSSTKIKFGTKKIGTDPLHPNYGHSDQIFPQLIGLSTKLYIPEICYDFDVKIGDYIRVNTTEDRIFSTSRINTTDPLIVKILLKSEQSDFDLIHSKGKIDFNNSVPLSFNIGESKVSPPSINAYLPAVSGGGNYMTLGEGYTNPIGGTIKQDVVNYAQFAFDFDNDTLFTTQFNINLSTAIQFSTGSTPIPYILTSAGSSSSFGHIDRCERNRVYDPVLGSFNVERNEVTSATSDPKERYPLYTQIAGRDFKVALVSYTGAPAYNIETPIDTTVELEVIDAGSFDNNASTGFDSVCQDPSSKMGKGTLFNFGGNSRLRNISILNDLPDYQKDIALQNSAFRVWVLTKDDGSGNREILHYNETDKTNFQYIYDNYYKNSDDNTTKYCLTSCSTNDGTDTCYECIKKYFSTPICSRDNFAIRPESYRVTLKDNNETDSIIPRYITNNRSTSIKKLAAGYKYLVDINSTLLNDTGRARGYYHHFREVNTSNPALVKDGAILEFTTSSPSCNDRNNSALDISMTDGHSLGLNYLSSKNVGDYDLWFIDSNWTKVDQAQYEFKKQFGDCGVNDPRAICSDCLINDYSTTPEGSKVGCTLYSDLTSTLYEKIPLSFKPYSFDLGSIDLQNEPDKPYLFMNDFSDSYYDLIMNAITMSTTFEGAVTAVGKDGATLSNFTDGCVASDVTLSLGRETLPSETSLLLEADPVKMQQYLQYISRTTPIDPINRLEGVDKNATIKKVAFLDTDEGNASIIFYSTIKKNQRAEHNPISVDYQSLHAQNSDSLYADMRNSYVPTGDKIYNENNVTYVYGKVSPEKRLFDNIETNSTLTPIFVDVYCDLGDTICGNNYDLNVTTHRDNPTGNWYLTGMFTTNEIGTTDLNTTLDGGSFANHRVGVNHPLTPIARAVNITDVPFDDTDMPASQKDVNVSVTGSARPSIIKVQYTPVPWLVYDPANDYYRVKFIGISDWTGVGKTGHVTDINSSKETLYRMNW